MGRPMKDRDELATLRDRLARERREREVAATEKRDQQARSERSA